MTALRSVFGGVLACALALWLAGAAQARPQTPAEERDAPYSGIVPACSNAASLSTIQSRFADREAEYWHSGLTIDQFEEVREIGFRSNGLDYIPRRYCEARVLMNDQKVRTVDYSIVEAGGSIGYTDDVVWCLVGLDRENDFSPACKMARP